MAVYIVTGKLGSGKTLISVGRIFDYLKDGRPVATNLDLHLDKYLRPTSKKTVVRIPDKPLAEDLLGLGYGNITTDEEKNGLIVLDELGSWLNTRSWQDKTRKPLLDWFIHARKYGWDLMLIVQDISMLDSQLRDALCEHLVVCRRLDRLRIPFIGGALQYFGLKGTLPKIHSAKAYYGDNELALIAHRWWYKGHDFYSAYDTKQIFSPSYAHGLYSILSPWLTKGRYLKKKLTLRQRFEIWLDTPRPKPTTEKLPLIQKIQKLPPEKRIEFVRRFQQAGSL